MLFLLILNECKNLFLIFRFFVNVKGNFQRGGKYIEGLLTGRQVSIYQSDMTM